MMTLPHPVARSTVPSSSAVPFSLMTTVASALLAVAVTVVDSTSFATEAVYVVVSEANAGDRVTPLRPGPKA